MRGGIEPEPASLAPFDHAIAYVPSLDLYLDGTAQAFADFATAAAIVEENAGKSIGGASDMRGAKYVDTNSSKRGGDGISFDIFSLMEYKLHSFTLPSTSWELNGGNICNLSNNLAETVESTCKMLPARVIAPISDLRMRHTSFYLPP